ncbi:uncharacterized protein RCC_10963 [Ramularia collo-cygni]|uniref:Uncharacterized protein n=1 Tax=Ramularia collo-cygni TaxID=112498 RepID=A0A2D3VPY0_9PEZI|nr:uncharacterized protein RCC_10963 [Ramularia collo-cygni]CZT25234.1 uncharacterized protein RCC_10963 [Ramularia collo-cygni]
MDDRCERFESNLHVIDTQVTVPSVTKAGITSSTFLSSTPHAVHFSSSAPLPSTHVPLSSLRHQSVTTASVAAAMANQADVSVRQNQSRDTNICSTFPGELTLGERICDLPRELYDEVLKYTVQHCRHRLQQLSSWSLPETSLAWQTPRASLRDIKVSCLVQYLVEMVEAGQNGGLDYGDTLRNMAQVFEAHPAATRFFLDNLRPESCDLLEAAEVLRTFLLARKHVKTTLVPTPEFKDGRFDGLDELSDELDQMHEQNLPTLLYTAVRGTKEGGSLAEPW